MLKEKKLIAFNYFGGKYTWLEEIYKYLPSKYHTSVELFGGSGVFTLNKIPSKSDTVNDLDGTVINFFKCLRDQPEELIQLINLTPVHRSEYDNCWPISGPDISELESARRFFVRCRMSFQGSGLKQHTGFNTCIKTSERGLSKNVSKFLSAASKLIDVVDRLKEIQFENKPYQEIIDRFSNNECFIYADPPYELRTRKYKKWYAHEFEDKDHIELSEQLHKSNAKVMISHSESDLYKDLYHDWNFIKFPERGHSMKGSKKQKECIWINYPINETVNSQYQLFKK